MTVVTNPVADYIAEALHAHFRGVSKKNFADAVEAAMRLIRNYRISGGQKKELVLEALRMTARMFSADASVFVLIDEYAGDLIDSLYRLHKRKFVHSIGSRLRRCIHPPPGDSPPHAASRHRALPARR